MARRRRRSSQASLGSGVVTVRDASRTLVTGCDDTPGRVRTRRRHDLSPYLSPCLGFRPGFRPYCRFSRSRYQAAALRAAGGYWTKGKAWRRRRRVWANPSIPTTGRAARERSIVGVLRDRGTDASSTTWSTSLRGCTTVPVCRWSVRRPARSVSGPLAAGLRPRRSTSRRRPRRRQNPSWRDWRDSRTHHQCRPPRPTQTDLRAAADRDLRPPHGARFACSDTDQH